MLIYNHKKEFFGIDEQDLKSLGFSSLSDLRAESDDFADLFVKEPGHIHNFKHIHWIDFAECSDSLEHSKVIIKTSSKSFKCSLEVKTAYLNDNPSEKAFLVYLQNLRELTIHENGEITETILTTSAPQIKEEIPKAVTMPEFTYEENSIEEEQTEDDFKDEKSFIEDDIAQPDFKEDIPNEIEHQEPEEKPLKEISDETEETYDAPLELNIDEPLNIMINEPENEVEEFEEVEEESYEEVENGYVYDPHVASAELGLPVDLIEEFIQDFVEQAKEFKSELYSSFEGGDTSTVKSLSHKLKGVAANLRIEDALEALTIINTADNQTEVKSNLDDFYVIISKLAGEKVPVVKKIKKRVTPPTPKERPIKEIKPEVYNNEDAMTIDFKDDIESKPEKPEPEKNAEAENEDDLVIDFKDDEQSYIKIDTPQELQDEANPEDDLVIDFKDENDYKEVLPPKEIKIESENEDDLTIDFKYEDTLDETGSENSVETEKPQDMEDLSIKYDKLSAAKEIGLNDESFKELFDDYISEAKYQSSEINNAIEGANVALWKSHAIQLKGMSDNMRVDDFKNELETLINTKDVKVAKEAAKKISILISKISDIES